jgi:hypothetical protein
VQRETDLLFMAVSDEFFRRPEQRAHLFLYEIFKNSIFFKIFKFESRVIFTRVEIRSLVKIFIFLF